MIKMHQRNVYFLLVSLLAIPCCVQAAPACSEWAAATESIQGKADVQLSDSFGWRPIKIGYQFCYGDKIRTSKHGRVTLVLKSGALLTLKSNSTLSFSSAAAKKPSWVVKLLNGSGLFRSRQAQRLNVLTPMASLAHEGTEFLVTVTSQQTETTVFDGQVKASNQMGEIHIKKGYKGIVSKNQSPTVHAITVRPEDAVQWSLYYPPVIDVSSFNKAELQPSIKAYQLGRTFQALELLEQITAPAQNTDFLTLKASLLLMLGSVDEALSLIDQALLQQPENSSAVALQSIIAVTKNRQDKAFSLAQKAVALAPQSATARIALSYAYQAQFKISEALTETTEAVRLSPDNALAWARLAELQLSSGERSEALKSAQKAETLNPALGRTQTVLGFNYLAQIDIDLAKIAFTQAIKLNSADPLAHLGLGLAKIRKGAIEEGARDIETAVSLDPDNAIMRSYLGKAYYELKNNEYAATELELAKERDVNDPTPWFYDAIRKQTTNRPVEALHDMQKAIELNDNRGVYRSKLLLDEDGAAKSANMARIYQDLGFDRVALKQAWTSLSQDYTNPSAHRFLSDTLQGRPRHRIARASELLQAQLFQPINTVPVQPQLTSENIGILNSTGPGSLSSNEYDPLFTSNGAHILLNGAVGSNNTLTDSAIVSGVYDQFSLSFGQFHYQTDGFRINDDYEQNIYNAFAQVAVTPGLNLQVEFKREDVTAGDVPLRFNDFHYENLRESIDQDTARFGLRYKINQVQDFILSALFTQVKEIETNRIVILKPPIEVPFLGKFLNSNIDTISVDRKESGYQLEGQYLFRPKKLNIIAGFGFINTDADDLAITQLTTSSQLIYNDERTPASPSLISETPRTTSINLETNIYSGYIYSQYELSKDLTSFIGLSYDSYDDGLIDKDNLNPKVGLIWSLTKKLTLRGAAFRTIKKPLATNQTIEPTQVAGFNQFFDDLNGTTSWNYGFGLDSRPLQNLYLGGEVIWRDTTQPALNVNESQVEFFGRDESAHLAYLYWVPFDWASLRAEYRYTEFRRDYAQIIDSSSSLEFIFTQPKSVEAHEVPISLSFYHSSGLFSQFTSTFIEQNFELINNGNNSTKDSDNFWIFDTVFGYRLPKRIGTLSLEVRNLFNNKNFKYHSVFDGSGPQLTAFVPEREIFFKLNIAY